jgi:hypothetical protein
MPKFDREGVIRLNTGLGFVFASFDYRIDPPWWFSVVFVVVGVALMVSGFVATWRELHRDERRV